MMESKVLGVLDVNTVWRSKPFEALSKIRAVLGISPRRWGSGDYSHQGASLQSLSVKSVAMPPGWATHLDWLAKNRFKNIIKLNNINGLVVTSPHYLNLAREINGQIPLYYYCSDNYSLYDKWGGDQLNKVEQELISYCKHSFFVSSVLAARAVEQQGAITGRITVCPNATTSANVLESKRLVPLSVSRILDECPRPIIGVVGAINERLDFDLLLSCAALRETGTLLMVGPVTNMKNTSGWEKLKRHAKCVITGVRPHSEIVHWMDGLDIALIPYANNEFNRSCSPMRLFDHLASPKPIVATRACAQVLEYDSFVQIGDSGDSIVDRIRELCKSPQIHPRSAEFLETISWNNRAHLISSKL